MLDFNFHSPTEALILPLYERKGVRVSVKRDDMIHPYISGNKWRKLKFPLREARATGKSRLVTFGGAWSNHLLATAAAAAKFGFSSYAFVRGERVENAVLSLCELFGMQLHFVDREAYRDKQALYAAHFGADANAFFINEGGYSIAAAKGCAEIIAELPRPFDHYFCACGTGTTLAGLANALADQGEGAQLHGVPVLKGGGFIREEIAALGVENPDEVILHLDYHFGGYAKTKPELIAFVRSFTQQTGMMIEPTYTGKLFYALHDLIARDYFPTGSDILVLHTGGLTGMLGMLEKFRE